MARKGKMHRSASQKQQFLAYEAENRQEKNKLSRLEKHVKSNPEDENAANSLKRILGTGLTYKRGTSRGSNFEPKRTQLEARLVRANTTGAVMRDSNDKLVPKALPPTPRGRFISNMTVAFNEAGIKNGRFYRALQA